MKTNYMCQVSCFYPKVYKNVLAPLLLQLFIAHNYNNMHMCVCDYSSVRYHISPGRNPSTSGFMNLGGSAERKRIVWNRFSIITIWISIVSSAYIYRSISDTKMVCMSSPYSITLIVQLYFKHYIAKTFSNSGLIPMWSLTAILCPNSIAYCKLARLGMAVIRWLLLLFVFGYICLTWM